MRKEEEGEDKSREAGEPPCVGASWAGKDFWFDFVPDRGRGVGSVQELPIGAVGSVI